MANEIDAYAAQRLRVRAAKMKLDNKLPDEKDRQASRALAASLLQRE